MKTTKILAILVLALGLMVCPAELAGAATIGTAFTYQGRLVDDNSVANGQYDFQFKVFDRVILGNQQGSTIYINALNVIDGNFTVELDFGSGIFYGDARWLEIGVQPAGTGSFTILSPLQEVKPTPNSIHATHALQADEADTLNGLDSTAFASVAHSHDGVYALISHTHSGSDITTGTVAEGLIDASIARDSELTWGNLAGIPAGFSDGIDNIGGTDSDWTISGNDMYSIPSGNVGIGTTNPLSKLSVGGEGEADTGVYGNGGSFGVYGKGYTGVFGRGSKWGVYGIDSDSGSYGILGSDTYGVYGSGSSVGVFGEDSDSGSSGRLGYGDYGGYFSGDGYFSGNVGVGTTSPDAKLEVNGDLKVTGAYKGDIGPNNGAPFPRPAYDSGWVSFTQGEIKTLTHSIGGNVDNYVVDMQFKDNVGNGIHIGSFGGMWDVIGDQRGAVWANLTTSTIQVVRFKYDEFARSIRIRIWVYN